MIQLRKMQTLGVCLAISLASPGLVFAVDSHRDPNQAANTLAEKVESGELITTSGNGENTPASGDMGKDTIPDPLASQEGNAASPKSRPDPSDKHAVAARTDDDSMSDSSDSMASGDGHQTAMETRKSSTKNDSSVANPGMHYSGATGRDGSMVARSGMERRQSSVASTHSGAQPEMDMARDQAITSAVKSGLSHSAVQVKTMNGVVSLTGQVASFDEKMRLARAAAMVDGVTQINASQLEVTSSAAVAKSEEE